MKLDHIGIEGFKSIKKTDIDLTNLNVLIGANGAGKTNFISLFKLLNKMLEGNFQTNIKEGGGAESFLHFGSKVTNEIKVSLLFGSNGYQVIFVPSASDQLVFKQEECSFHDRSRYPKPKIEILDRGHLETTFFTKKDNAISPIAHYVKSSLLSWKYYHFHDTSDSAKVKKTGAINDNLYLRTDASNLAAFLYVLKSKNQENYDAIREHIRLVAPFFDDFLLRPTALNEDKIRLEWKERGSDFPFLAHHLSDGTLRFICLATVLLQPKNHLPSTIIIDEPELGLHPYAIKVLASLMKATSKKTQIIVSTQSVPLVNEFEVEDLIVVDKKENASEFVRPSAEKMKDWLDEYTLGELWEKNVLGGRPQ